MIRDRKLVRPANERKARRIAKYDAFMERVETRFNRLIVRKPILPGDETFIGTKEHRFIYKVSIDKRELREVQRFIARGVR